jgi:hypothetical protein
MGLLWAMGRGDGIVGDFSALAYIGARFTIMEWRLNGGFDKNCNHAPG